MTIRNQANHLVYANRAALDLLGMSSVDELRETPPEQIMADYIVSGESGRPVTMDDIPSVRLLRGEDPDPLVIRTVHRNTGQLRWQLLKSAPLLDADGEIEATIMMFEDVTDRKRAERQAVFLAQVSAAAGVVAGLRADAAQRRRARGARRRRLVRRRPASTRTATAGRLPSPTPTPTGCCWPSSCATTSRPSSIPSAGWGWCSAPASRC